MSYNCCCCCEKSPSFSTVRISPIFSCFRMTFEAATFARYLWGFRACFRLLICLYYCSFFCSGLFSPIMAKAICRHGIRWEISTRSRLFLVHVVNQRQGIRFLRLWNAINISQREAGALSPANGILWFTKILGEQRVCYWSENLSLL